MPMIKPNISENQLGPCRSEEDYLLHSAALEWSISDPIVIQGPEDIASRVNWRDTLEPFDHQVQNLITFCKRLPVTLLADDVGLGKTISAGLILSELMFRRRVNKALILCPKILGAQWVEELDYKFKIKSVFASGMKEYEQALAGKQPVIVTTYNTGANALLGLKKNSFDMLILDEAHKLRNLYGTPKTPKMAESVHLALKTRLFRFVLMLTATPIQNRLWDIYSLVDLLTTAKGHKNPLGNKVEFRRNFILPGSNDRKFIPEMEKQFRPLVRDYIVRTRRGDAKLQFPDREVTTFPVTLSAEEKRLTALMAEYINHFHGLSQSSLAESLMSSPAAFIDQLQEMAKKEYLATELLQKVVETLPDGFESAKQKGVIKICRELSSKKKDWRLIIFTKRIETLKAIGKSLNREGIACGFIRGGHANQNQKTIDNFRSEPPKIHVIVSTDAGAEGVNLQAGNVLLNYDLPWNPMVVEQRIGRIQRLASTHAKVIILNMYCVNTVEEKIVVRLIEKLQTISHAVGDIESILEATNSVEEESFEKQIQEMVIKSLKGQDVGKDVRDKLASFQRAKEAIELAKEFLEDTLGTSEPYQDNGPQVPKLSKNKPFMPFEEFSIRAKKAQGMDVRENSPGVFSLTKKGKQTEMMVFDETLFQEMQDKSVFMGNVSLYQPGKTDFERLVQHWVDRCGHYVVDSRSLTETDLVSLAKEYCSRFPGVSYESHKVISQADHFQGAIEAMAKASNGVDAFEKVIREDHVPNGHPKLSRSDFRELVMVDRKNPTSIFKTAASFVESRVVADREINHFCDFYDKRLIEELPSTAGDPQLEKKIRDNFQSNILAEISSMKGFLYHEVVLSVQFRKDGQGPYSSILTVIPFASTILSKPFEKECAVTGQQLPETCLEKCSITGLEAASHLLESSAESGRKAIPEKVTTCQESNHKALMDEVETSARSGVTAFKKYFVTCEETNNRILSRESARSSISRKLVDKSLLLPSAKNPERYGLASEHFTCQKTGKSLLIDEIETCTKSWFKVDGDLLQECRVTGKRVLPEFLTPCEVSGDLCLPESLKACTVSRKNVRPDLLFTSAVSGYSALPEYASTSEVSGLLCLAGELLTCSITGKRALPDEMGTCAVSGKICIRSELVQCAVTKDFILKRKADRSDYSGLIARKDLFEESAKPPHRKGLDFELATCQETGAVLLKDEVYPSDVSGKIVDQELLLTCPITQKKALKSELVFCHERCEYIHSDVAGVCEYSGNTFWKNLLVPSAVSGKLIQKRTSIMCAITGMLAMPSETGVCQITGRNVLNDQLGTCEETSQKVGRDLLGVCEVTGKKVLQNFLGTSYHSKKSVLKSLLIPSDKNPERFGIQEEMVSCSITGRVLLVDETKRSDYSNRTADLDCFEKSEISQKFALADEIRICENTGLKLTPDEVGVCFVSGKTVDLRLLARCEDSEQLALEKFMGICGIINKKVLKTKLTPCSLTGRQGLGSYMVQCGHSNKPIFPDQAVECQVTGKLIGKQFAGNSDYSGLLVDLSLLTNSEKAPFRKGIESEFKRCSISGKKLLLDEIGISDWSRNWVDKALLIKSSASGKLATREEMVQCQESKNFMLPDEVLRCSVTGNIVDKRLLVKSQLSGELALRRLTGVCEVTKKLVFLKELRICPFSKLKVVPSELVTCAETGLLGARVKMLKSSVSGKYVCPQRAIRSASSDLIGMRAECVKCSWYCKPVLKTEAGRCELTHLNTSKEFLNSHGELRTLRQLLNGINNLFPSENCLDYSSKGLILGILKSIEPSFFKNAVDVSGFKGPGSRYALCVELKQWLGLATKYAGFLLDLNPPRIIGSGVIGTRSKDNFEIEQNVTFKPIK